MSLPALAMEGRGRSMEGRGRGPIRMPMPPTGPPPSLPPGTILPGMPPGVSQAILNSLRRRSIPRMGPISDEQLIAELNAELRRAQNDLNNHQGSYNIIRVIKYGGALVAVLTGTAFFGPAGGLAAGALFRGTEGTTEVFVRSRDSQRTGREVVYQGLGELAGAATGNPVVGFVVRAGTKEGARAIGEADLTFLFENEKKRGGVKTSGANARTESSHPGFGPSSPAGWRGPIK